MLDSNSSSRLRWQIRLDEEGNRLVTETAEDLGVPRNRVMTRALRLYRIFLQAQARGERIEVVERDGSRTRLEVL